MTRHFESKDEGKSVMTANGDMVGTVEKVSGGAAHVKPDADLSTATRNKLGWTKEGEDVYEIKIQHVEEINDDGIHLKSDL